jgi:hypothetical protein
MELVSNIEKGMSPFANKWKVAIYGSEKEEIASYDTEGERNIESITKVKYRVKSLDVVEKTLSVIREVTWA